MSDREWEEDELARLDELRSMPMDVLAAVLATDIADTMQAVIEHGNTDAALLGCIVEPGDIPDGRTFERMFWLHLGDGRAFRVTVDPIEARPLHDPEPDVPDEGFNAYLGQYDNDC